MRKLNYPATAVTLWGVVEKIVDKLLEVENMELEYNSKTKTINALGLSQEDADMEKE